MKISLSFERSKSEDVTIMVDLLRASSTITLALNKFNKIIPTCTPEESLKISKKQKCVLAGERNGSKIEGFDFGNSPKEIEEYIGDVKTLILTTTNGTRILENMNGTVLIGSILNAKSVAKIGIKLATEEIEIVMAGVKGEFAIEDFLAGGKIVKEIISELNSKNIPYETNDLANASLLAINNANKVKESIVNSKTAKRLIKLGHLEDINICIKNNISENVAIYKDGILKKI